MCHPYESFWRPGAEVEIAIFVRRRIWPPKGFVGVLAIIDFRPISTTTGQWPVATAHADGDESVYQ